MCGALKREIDQRERSKALSAIDGMHRESVAGKMRRPQVATKSELLDFVVISRLARGENRDGQGSPSCRLVESVAKGFQFFDKGG